MAAKIVLLQKHGQVNFDVNETKCAMKEHITHCVLKYFWKAVLIIHLGRVTHMCVFKLGRHWLR